MRKTRTFAKEEFSAHSRAKAITSALTVITDYYGCPLLENDPREEQKEVEYVEYL